MRNSIILISIFYLVGCSNKKKEWKFLEEVLLDSIAPIGMVIKGDTLVISDGDQDRLVYVTASGNFLRQVKGFNRPMHIANAPQGLLVPNYATDDVKILQGQTITTLKIPFELDAPAGVASYGNEIAVADFYHHRFLFYNGTDWRSIGEKGTKNAQFYYPTDVYLSKNNIYVADAYNHRVQVFDKKGAFLQAFGKEEKMNASTGLTVGNSEVYITDFEQNRVLVYSKKGELLQILSKKFDKPIDVYLHKGILYVLNYEGQSIVKYKKQQV